MKSSHQPPNPRSLPSLPPELWIGIIRCLCQNPKGDLAYLWTECRDISKLFRNEVERFFVSKYLPKTRIQFKIGKNHA